MSAPHPAPLSDDEFDKAILTAVAAVERALSGGRYDSYTTTAFLIHPASIQVVGLIGPEGDPEDDIYQLLLLFGRRLAGSALVPQAAFVAAQSVWEDGTECVFISGCTPDGRKNGYRLPIHRTSAGMITLSERIPLPYAAGHRFEGRTYAGEFLRGLLAAEGMSR